MLIRCSVLLFILAVFGLSPRAEGLEMRGEPLVEAAETTAEIVWQTDAATGSVVDYGVAEDFKNLRAETAGEVDELHAVTLTGLLPGTTYYFSVGTKRSRLGSGTFTTQGTAPAPPTMTNPNQPEPQKIQLPTVLQAPATRITWGHLPSLRDHFERHGADFKSVGPEHYAAQAWAFLQRALVESFPMKLDHDGTVRVWDPKSRAFAAYNANGTTKTYFKPNDPTYWERQPGAPIYPANQPFAHPPPAPIHERRH